MKYLGAFLILYGLLCAPQISHAANLSEQFSGRILLQVQEKGKAWYVDPLTRTRVYLGRPADAFRVMRELGLGISNKDLEKIASSEESIVRNAAFVRKLQGRIVLQVEANGEAWYVNPIDLKRYFLGRPTDAFTVMRGQGLGISNDNISRIATAEKYTDPEQPSVYSPSSPSEQFAAKPSSSSQSSITQSKDMSGSYRCYSYNVSGGGGGDCRLFAPIILNKNGTYSVSSEKGTYTAQGDVMMLSESKLRGTGKILGGNQLRFEYDYNGWHHTITYLKEGGSSSSSENDAEIPVQLILEYPVKDSVLGGIATVELVPEGGDVKTDSYKPTAIAQYDGDKRIVGSFYKTSNKPKSGKKYTIYTNTGTGTTAVGTLDLTSATKETTATIKVVLGSVSEAKKSEVVQSNAPDIEVDLTLVYDAKDSSLGSINFVSIIPVGDDPVTTTYKPTATAIWDGDRTITVSFFKSMNRIKTKAKYDVYTDNGYGVTKVGSLDLTNVTKDPFAQTIMISVRTISSGTATGKSSTASPQSSPQSVQQPSSQAPTQSQVLPVCNPTIPKYSQPECREQ